MAFTFGPRRCTIPISGAKLMKTNQTISYAAGDDGDIEYGRQIDFFTLPSSNPFGNSFRFTGTTGGYYDAGDWRDSAGSIVAEASAIPDDIVVDWSTYDGSTVLGWYRVLRPLHNWATALTDATSFSVGAFTSGWTLPNTNQYFTIWNWGSSATNHGDRFAYEPFGIFSTEYWTSTTPVFRTTDAVTLPASTTIPVFSRAKTGSFRNLLCREFTVTGTTLT